MAKLVFRLRAVQIGFALSVVVLWARMAQLQIADGAEYAAKAREQRTERVLLRAQRGSIYDRSGVPLVLTQESYHVGIAPNELRDVEGDARLIAGHLGLPLREVRRLLSKRWVHLDGPFSSSQVHALRKVRGVHLTEQLVRFRPDPDIAVPLLGSPAVAGRSASGLERVLDTLLSGIDGSAVVLRDHRGRKYESPSRLDAFPVSGNDVYLTIDAELQEIVERALQDAIASFDASGGDVIVVDPRSGEVLAAASRDAEAASKSGFFTDVFEPGSTAKLFAAAALLKHGLVSENDSVWGENGSYVVGRRTIEDVHPEGWMDLQTVIERSSNIGIAKFVTRLSSELQYEMLRDFGLGTLTGIEFPAESRGLLSPPHLWSGTSSASLAMGYEVAVTPLQLAMAYGAIANHGVLVRPTLIREIRKPDGELVYRHVPEPVRRVLTADVAARLQRMLRGVVYRGGTGSTASLTSYEVAGKTGTVRRAGRGGYIPGSYTASFASVFPADDPQLAIVVRLDDPRGVFARLSAAPLTRSVLEQVLAARTGALDRGRLTSPSQATVHGAVTFRGVKPRVFSWPVTETPSSSEVRVVPDVVGLKLRAAVRRVHQSGLRARIEGWGRIRGMTPTPGDSVPSGTVVTLMGTERRRLD